MKSRQSEEKRAHHACVGERLQLGAHASLALKCVNQTIFQIGGDNFQSGDLRAELGVDAFVFSATNRKTIEPDGNRTSSPTIANPCRRTSVCVLPETSSMLHCFSGGAPSSTRGHLRF